MLKLYTPILAVVSCSTALNLFAQITNPIPEAVPTGDITVKLAEVAQIPDAGSDAARMNHLEEAPDGSGRLFLNDQQGRIWILEDGEDPVLYVDVSEHLENFQQETGQQGLSSFALHPDFAENGKLYTVSSMVWSSNGSYDFPAKRPIINSNGEEVEPSHVSVLVEWTADDPASNEFSGEMQEMISFEQPFPDHNIGLIAFNPNAESGGDDYGMLYVALADGGSDGFPVRDTDPLDNGQDLGTPLGAILRLDPMGDNGVNGNYGYPESNPFADDGDDDTLGEIWCYGLRNPHRFSWDLAGDKMLIADIGQWYIEEVNFGVAGGNYGWGDREGWWLIDEHDEFVLHELPDDDGENDYLYPVTMYDHPGNPDRPWSGSGAIAGAQIYRGAAAPSLYGKVVFADFSNDDDRFFYVDLDELSQGSWVSPQVLRLQDAQGGTRTFRQIIGSDDRTDVRFGVDFDGELYVLNKHDGWVRRVVATDGEVEEFELSSTEREISTAGESFSVSVTAPASDSIWAISSRAPWVMVKSPRENTGDATIDFEVPPNPSFFPRTAVITIAGNSFEITQAADSTIPDYLGDARYTGEGNFDVNGWGVVNVDAWPWVRYEPMGYLYATGPGAGEYYLYSFYADLEWLYLQPNWFPWVYTWTHGWVYVMADYSDEQILLLYVYEDADYLEVMR